MPGLKNRKGAILVLAAFTMVVLVIMLAFVIDVSRMLVQKNELQTGTDAAAHASAIQLLIDPAQVAAVASAAGARNLVLGRATTFPASSVQCGVWDGTTNGWSGGSPHTLPCTAADNAVQVSGSDPTSYLFQSVLGAAAQQVHTIAVAWAAPQVTSSNCVKPWGMFYSELTKRLNPSASPSRDLTAADLVQLATLPVSQLTVTLKQGAPPSPSGGNFGAMDFGNGANAYGTYINTCYPVVLGPGDIIDTETGNMAGPTRSNVCILCNQPGMCSGNPPTYTCRKADGSAGVPVKVPLFDLVGPKSSGKYPVTIRMISGFTLDQVSNKGSEITGHFVRAIDEGAIGTKYGTLVRLVLVQ